MRRSWFREPAPSHPLSATLATLLSELGMRVGRPVVEERLMSHPLYPSLASVSDVLRTWRVQASGVHCPLERLDDVPLPCLAQLSDDGGRSVVITAREGDRITMIDARRGEIMTSVEALRPHWTAALLVIEAQPEASARGPWLARHRDELALAGRSLALPLAVIVVITCAAVQSWVTASVHIGWILAIKVVGLALCGLLVAHEIDPHGSSVARICRPGARIDCHSVLHSSAARLMGTIPLVDVGLVYFAGGIVALAVSARYDMSGSALRVLSAMNLAALPYTAFSIYYQTYRIRRWCVLCVSVQVILWLEFVALQAGSRQAPETWLAGALLVAISFLVTALVWWAARAGREDAQGKVRRWALERIRLDPRLLRYRIAQQAVDDTGAFGAELRLGATEAEHELTVVIHPQCAHCAREFHELQELLEELPDRTTAVIRFLCPESIGLGRELARSICALVNAGRHHDAQTLLERWFANPQPVHVQDGLVAARAGVTADLEAGDRLVSAHAAWAAQLGISNTPTLLYNGRQLPADIRIAELRYVIKYAALTEQERAQLHRPGLTTSPADPQADRRSVYTGATS